MKYGPHHRAHDTQPAIHPRGPVKPLPVHADPSPRAEPVGYGVDDFEAASQMRLRQRMRYNLQTPVAVTLTSREASFILMKLPQPHAGC